MKKNVKELSKLLEDMFPKEKKEEGKEKCILFNLSGHGLIDMAAYDQYLAGDLLNYNLPEEEIAKNIKELEKII